MRKDCPSVSLVQYFTVHYNTVLHLSGLSLAHCQNGDQVDSSQRTVVTCLNGWTLGHCDNIRVTWDWRSMYHFWYDIILKIILRDVLISRSQLLKRSVVFVFECSKREELSDVAIKQEECQQENKSRTRAMFLETIGSSFVWKMSFTFLVVAFHEEPKQQLGPSARPSFSSMTYVG